MKRWFAVVAVGMVALYIALAVGAAGCLFSQEEGHGHAHHTPSHASHSPLCAWSCQANPTESIHTAVPFVVGFAVVAIRQPVNADPEALLRSTVSRSRAPPA